ncbi:MAG: hypothetical protein HFF17_04615 [Oscillospiraceae bacterium]|nr:hypothetical protein [Oscillospiraceae bacterium]
MAVKGHGQDRLHLPAAVPAHGVFQVGQGRGIVVRGEAQQENAGLLDLNSEA